jgi:hypothetical protein
MQKISADMVGIEPIGCRAEEDGELLEVMDVGLDGSGRSIAELEVVDESLTQRCHGNSRKKERWAAAASMEQEWQKRKSAQSLQVDLRRQGTPEPSEGALEVKRGSRQLPKVSFNDTLHLPGRLQGTWRLEKP